MGMPTVILLFGSSWLITKKNKTTTTNRGDNAEDGTFGFNKGVDPWWHAQQMLVQGASEP